jgi:AcrR family transcriptional regulator
VTRRTPEPAPPYHHGALRSALIEATEALLAERGPDSFSLREVARRAGVSPAAPAHHFGDATGLLTAVATHGFEALTQALLEGVARGGADPLAALREQGVAYVRYALRHPGRFRLMFREGVLRKDPPFLRHAGAAFEVLAGGVRRAVGVETEAQMTPAHWSAVIALWSQVHGFAHLAIAGRFDAFAAADGMDAFVGRALPEVLDALLRGLFPRPAGRRRRSAAKLPRGGARR